jgi:hypothetical protein
VVERHRDGGLQFNGVGPYREISPGVFSMPIGEFQPDEDPTRTAVWAFELDADGHPVAAHSHLASDDVYLRAGILGDLHLVRHALILAISLALTGLLAVLWRDGERSTRLPRFAALLLALATTVALFCVAFAFSPPTPNIGQYMLYGKHVRLYVLVAATHLIAVLAIVLIVQSILAWSRQYWGSGARALTQRAHLSLLALSGFVMLPLLYSLNLILAPLP